MGSCDKVVVEEVEEGVGVVMVEVVRCSDGIETLVVREDMLLSLEDGS